MCLEQEINIISVLEIEKLLLRELNLLLKKTDRKEKEKSFLGYMTSETYSNYVQVIPCPQKHIYKSTLSIRKKNKLFIQN